MHPRNRYRDNKPDFGELAEFHPSLRPFLILKQAKQSKDSLHTSSSSTTLSSAPSSSTPSTPSSTTPSSSSSSSTLTPHPYTINFGNPAALRELTCAVLERDFNLRLEIPLDRLIPTVPLRLNYIHWIEDLLSCSRSDEEEERGEDSVPQGEGVTGVDIGTGASCIYPLLGARMNGWRFLATDIDPDAVKYAMENVRRNQLEQLITIKQVATDTTLVGALDSSSQYDFCMCNPPFFKSWADRLGGKPRSTHRPPPSTHSTGCEGETVTSGGEEEFVRRIVEDSVKLGTSVRWYSSMLGKKASLKGVRQELRKHQVPVVTTTEFMQGKTWRWAIAWSFDSTLTNKAAQRRKATKRQHPLVVDVSMASQPLPASPEGFRSALQWLQEQLDELRIDYQLEEEEEQYCASLQCKAVRNTWSNQRKKRRILEKLKKEQLAKLIPESDPDGSKRDTQNVKLNPSASISTARAVIEHSMGSSPAQEMSEVCVRVGDTAAQSLSGCHGDEGLGAVSLKVLQPQKLDDSLSDSDAYRQAMVEIEALCTPCNVEFHCSVTVGESLSRGEKEASSSVKHKKRTVMDDDSGPCGQQVLQLTFEWTRGNDRDLLHQIVQYLRNKMQ